MAAGAVLALPAPRFPLTAQVAPNQRWRTIATPHFRVHFPPALEEQARRTAANAERAYAQLAAELVPPRGPVEIVLADDVDYSNGSATPVPSNRIVLYAAPPVDASALRYNADWSQLVVTHELTHVFHLDRARGLWRGLQQIFGRNPLLFPNAYAPAWITEGIAVYYETRFTGLGRVAGSEHRMIARASALEHRVPRLDELSAATPRFPGGNAPYAYGSLFIDYLARTRGPDGLRSFIETSSGQLVPLWLNRAALRGFGVRFDRAFAEWSDSLARAAARDGAGAPLAGWRELTSAGYVARYPRWAGADTILYAGTKPRESSAAYRIAVGGGERRIGRRSSVSPQVPLPGGALLYAQLDFTDPYRVRSDLWVQRGGRERRLTRGARLIHPDARRDGAIVAVQYTGAGTQLVRVSGDAVTLLAAGSPDLLWSEPRWSPDGTRIAAVRWRRGGITEIVVLDTSGAERRAIAGARAVQSSPSWTPDGRELLFASDRGGVTDVYAAPAEGDGAPRRVSRAATGLFEPALSPDGRTLAAVLFRADGYHVGVAPYDSASRAGDVVDGDGAPSAAVLPVLRDGAPARPYSPWRTLLPRFWFPMVESGLTPTGVRWGGYTLGADVVGRHGYAALLELPDDGTGAVAAFDYAYRGLGQPLLGLSLRQDWENELVVYARDDPNTVLGALRRRTRSLDLTASLLRPRFRHAASLTFGAGVEQRRFARDEPAVIDPWITRFGYTTADSLYARAFAAASWNNVQRPPYSISPEDGVSAGGSVVQRWNTTRQGSSAYTAVGALAGYKSLDLPGFAHHVLAARLAGGRAGRAATSPFEVGGTSGNAVELLPGYVLGEGRRTFGVRGFPARSLEGYAALAGSLEYRAPLALAARGLRLLPLFLDRTSLHLFADAGSASCPADRATRRDCLFATALDEPIASAGAELNVTAAVFNWDAPYRFRLGVAKPIVGRARAERSGARVPGADVYFTAGLAF